jgi:hypothetical protein
MKIFWIGIAILSVIAITVGAFGPGLVEIG